MQVSQADQYASTVFVYNLCTVQIMHNIFLVLSLFVLRRLVNSCVKSDIVHFTYAMYKRPSLYVYTNSDRYPL